MNMYDQYIRLLAEINAVGLTEQQREQIADSMDCNIDFIEYILENVEEDFQYIKITGSLNLKACN